MAKEFQLSSPTAIHGEAVAGRSFQVRRQIDTVRDNLGEFRWELAELLNEVQEKHYHAEWGWPNFDDYIEALVFDISPREARYHIRIHRVSQELGITREQRKRVAISTLKQIFRLDKDTQADEIRRLMSLAEVKPDDEKRGRKPLTLAQVTTEVHNLKAEEGAPEMSWRNFYMVKEAAEGYVDPAIEKAKLQLGTVENAEGETVEPSNGMAAEKIFVEWLQSQTDEDESSFSEAEEDGPIPEEHIEE